MLSAQIFQDSENSSVSSIKSLKLSSGDKPKASGLKISTNTFDEKKTQFCEPVKNFNQEIVKPKCNSFEEKNIHMCEPVKNFDKEGAKPKLQNLNKVENNDEWPDDIENMYIYNEPEDDYEDILPKSKRFTKEDIDFFFRPCYFQCQLELTLEDDLPNFTLEEINFPDNLPDIISDSELYEDIPLEAIPEPFFLT